MVNLIGNAIRYSPEHSTIWIRVEGEGDLAKVKVADQGRGIAPQDQDKNLDKFERLGRDEAGGSGSGLYVSRTLSRAMKGALNIQNRQSEGERGGKGVGNKGRTR